MQTKINYNSVENQKIKEEFVRREVIHCASNMIHELALDADYNTDEIINVCSMIDPENPDGDYLEALEHWIVTPWLGEKLREKGEMVEEIFDFTIWGRRTSGQAIILDGVISAICADLEILDGQKNSWK